MRRADGAIVAGSATGAIGAALAAVFATLCCAGPAFVAGVLGAGGALAAARLEPYRPYFLAASAVMLALGFWRAYRPGRASATGVACSVRAGRLARSILWLSALITLASAIAPRFWS